MEYLQTNCILLGDFRNQIYVLIPYYQKEIVWNWNHVTDKKFEFETLKQQVKSIQSEEVHLQNEKKNYQNN